VCVVAASAQYVYTVIVRLTYKNRILNFIDLCSTANISVFLLTTQRYGYYIHGQCVHGASDVSLAMWYENFRAEEASFATSMYTLVLWAVFDNDTYFMFFFHISKKHDFFTYFFEMTYQKVVTSHTQSIRFAECLEKFWPQNSLMLWVLIDIYHTQIIFVTYIFLKRRCKKK